MRVQRRSGRPRGAQVRLPRCRSNCWTTILPVHSYEESEPDGVRVGGCSYHAVVDATPGFRAGPRMQGELMHLAGDASNSGGGGTLPVREMPPGVPPGGMASRLVTALHLAYRSVRVVRGRMAGN
jgi:hypothetical protein